MNTYKVRLTFHGQQSELSQVAEEIFADQIRTGIVCNFACMSEITEGETTRRDYVYYRLIMSESDDGAVAASSKPFLDAGYLLDNAICFPVVPLDMAVETESDPEEPEPAVPQHEYMVRFRSWIGFPLIREQLTAKEVGFYRVDPNGNVGGEYIARLKMPSELAFEVAANHATGWLREALIGKDPDPEAEVNCCIVSVTRAD